MQNLAKKISLKALLFLLVFTCVATQATYAQDANMISSTTQKKEITASKPALEINLFLPFLGVTDLKVIVPTLVNKKSNSKQALIFGVFADYSWGNLTRPVNDFGKVRFIGARLGYRQYFWRGIHADAMVNAGHRHEEKNIYDGTTLNSFTSRLWLLGGYQGDISTKLYFNIRAGSGIHITRLGDRFAHTERKVLPAFEVNLGIRL